MEKLANGVADALLWLATVCGMALTLFVAAAACMRYFIGTPLPFTEELVGLLFSALVFLALPYVTLHGQHIEVTLLTDMLPPALRRLAQWASKGLVLLFCVWFGSYAYDFALMSFDLGSSSDIANITLWPWMALMVLACLLMGLYTVYRLLRPAPSDESLAPPSV